VTALHFARAAAAAAAAATSAPGAAAPVLARTRLQLYVAEARSMIVKILNGPDSKEEWCLLEFQGEMVGELSGNELGQIVIKEVRRSTDSIHQHGP
jgi:hypothetical protein